MGLCREARETHRTPLARLVFVPGELVDLQKGTLARKRSCGVSKASAGRPAVIDAG